MSTFCFLIERTFQNSRKTFTKKERRKQIPKLEIKVRVKVNSKQWRAATEWIILSNPIQLQWNDSKLFCACVTASKQWINCNLTVGCARITV